MHAVLFAWWRWRVKHTACANQRAALQEFVVPGARDYCASFPAASQAHQSNVCPVRDRLRVCRVTGCSIIPSDDAAFDAIDIRKLAKLAGSSAPGISISSCISACGCSAARSYSSWLQQLKLRLRRSTRLSWLACGTGFASCFYLHRFFRTELSRAAIGVEKPAIGNFEICLFLAHLS